MGRRVGGRAGTGLVVTAALATVLAVGFDLSAIASIVSFVFTTLVEVVGAAVALVVILLVSVGLDFGWKRSRVRAIAA